MLDQQLSNTWKDYATVKIWKKDLKVNSKSNRLPKSTEDAIDSYMPLFLEFKQKNPDEIIEEALAGKYVVKESLSDFQTWLEDEKGKKFNHAVQISYYTIRGFYSHNNINTQKIRTPKVEPSKVLTDDDRVPLFDIIETERDGKTLKEKVLRREFLKSFLEFLSPRDKIIAMCLKDSALDSGDLLSLPLSSIRYQDPKEERIFVRTIRSKTREFVCSFFSTETTKLLKNYERMYRKDALDTEPIFVQSARDFKIEFTKIHQRPFMKDLDEMILKPVNTHILSMNFRTATKKLEKQLGQKLLMGNNQSPLRPKRFRKLFSDVCSDVGLDTDIKRIFMGKSDPANKTYESHSRQSLELFFEKIEPKLTIYSEPQNENDLLELKKIKDNYSKLEKQFNEFKNSNENDSGNENYFLSQMLKNGTKKDYERFLKLFLENKKE